MGNGVPNYMGRALARAIGVALSLTLACADPAPQLEMTCADHPDHPEYGCVGMMQREAKP